MAVLNQIDFNDIQAENSSVLQQINFKDIDLITGKDIFGRKTISSSLDNILTTPEGNIPGMVTFGFGVNLFEPNDIISQNLMKSEVARVVQKWDNRLTVQDINITSNQNYLNITLNLGVSDNSEFNAEVSVIGV